MTRNAGRGTGDRRPGSAVHVHSEEPPRSQRLADRRDFLQSMAGAFGVAWLGGLRPSPVPRFPSRQLAHIGVQLYTVRQAMQQNLEQTIAQVAKIGYDQVEFAGYFGRSAKDIRAVLDANGLTSPSAHSADMTSVRTRFAQVLEDAVTVGHRQVICASLPRGDQTADGFKRVAAEFNKAGEEAAKAGVRFGYHNHDFEFRALDGGGIGYDILLAETDPKLVTFQMDLFWISKGGRDPLAYFAKHPGRFGSVHVKDMDATGGMADVGAGQLPFGKWFAQSDQAGIRYYFVEHDNPGADPMGSIANSYRALKALEF